MRFPHWLRNLHRRLQRPSQTSRRTRRANQNAQLPAVPAEIETLEARSLLSANVLTDTTPLTTLTVYAGSGTGNVVLATFTDSNSSAVAADFTAGVNWGGAVTGSPVVSVILVSSTASTSTWEIVGNAVYTAAGNYTATVTVSDNTAASVQSTDTSFRVLAGSPSNAFSFAGQYSVTTPGSNALTLASIAQVGVQLTMTAGATTSGPADIACPGQLLQDGAVVGYFENGRITFTSGPFAGPVWTKLDLPGDFTDSNGLAAHVVTNGTALTFTDGSGNTSPGYWINPTQVIATAWNNEVGTVGNGMITWSDCGVWRGHLTVTGTNGGSGTTSLSASPNQVFVVDYDNGHGKTVHVVFTGTNGLIFVESTGRFALGNFLNATQAASGDYVNDNVTFSGDQAIWQDGAVWTRTSSPSSTVVVTEYINSKGLPVYTIQSASKALAFIDSRGSLSLGSFLDSTHAISNLYPGDVATFSAGRVNWHDGSIWFLTTAPTSRIVVTDYDNGHGKTVHVVQTGPNDLVFIDASGHIALGKFVNGTQAASDDYANDLVTFSGDLATWQDGAVWTRITAATTTVRVSNYVNSKGIPVYTIQNGTSFLVFVDGAGNTSLGMWLDGARAVSKLYPTDVATFGARSINWQDGSTWIMTADPPVLVTATDANNVVSHANLVDGDTVIGFDGSLLGMIGIRQNGKIVWTTNAAPQVTVTDFINPTTGLTTHLIQNGTGSVVFVTGSGAFVIGYLTGRPGEAVVPDWGNMTAVYVSGVIHWSDGSVWNPTNNAAPQITVTNYSKSQNPNTTYVIQNHTNTVVFVTTGGAFVLGNLTAPHQVTIPAWGNMVATFGVGKISWPDGSTWNQGEVSAWTNFDVNALNALFRMGIRYL